MCSRVSDCSSIVKSTGFQRRKGGVHLYVKRAIPRIRKRILSNKCLRSQRSLHCHGSLLLLLLTVSDHYRYSLCTSPFPIGQSAIAIAIRYLLLLTVSDRYRYLYCYLILITAIGGTDPLTKMPRWFNDAM